MFPALCVIVALKLKQQIAHFFAENRQKLLNSLFKTDVSLKNLNDEMLLDNLLSIPTNVRTLKIRRCSLIQSILLTTTKRFKRPVF